MKLTEQDIKKLTSDVRYIKKNGEKNIADGWNRIVDDLTLLSKKLTKKEFKQANIHLYFVATNDGDFDHYYKDERESINENNYEDIFDDFYEVVDNVKTYYKLHNATNKLL